MGNGDALQKAHDMRKGPFKETTETRGSQRKKDARCRVLVKTVFFHSSL